MASKKSETPLSDSPESNASLFVNFLNDGQIKVQFKKSAKTISKYDLETIGIALGQLTKGELNHLIIQVLSGAIFTNEELTTIINEWQKMLLRQSLTESKQKTEQTASQPIVRASQVMNTQNKGLI